MSCAGSQADEIAERPRGHPRNPAVSCRGAAAHDDRSTDLHERTDALSYRDIIVAVTVLALLPKAFTKPFFGLLLYTFLAYMRPQDLCWGFAKPIRYSFYCALLMYSGWFVHETRKFTRWSTPTRWLLAFIVCLTISLINSKNRNVEDRQFEKYFDLLKVFLVTFFTVGMVDDKDRLRKILWVITLSFGFFGVKYGLHGVLRGGRILQGPGGMLLDNNDLSLALVMTMPLLFFMGRNADKRWQRRLCNVAVALTCVAIVCTLSRGGFLGMCLAALLIFNKLRRSLLPWFFAGAIACAVPFVLPDDAKERLATLQAPEEDGSAAGRLYAWKVGLKMVTANPFFGVGFEGFISNFRRFDPIQTRGNRVKSIRVAHNTYIQVWAELGTPALICFLGMMVSALLCLRRARRDLQARAGPQVLIDYTNMVEISLICFMFGANFLNRAHFDLTYHLVALSAVIGFVVRDELAKLAPPLVVSRPSFGPVERGALASSM